MKILYAASEAAPFAKSGGLADVAGALPKALVRDGIDARVVMPLYGDLKFKDTLTYVTNFSVPVGWRSQYCGLFKAERDGVVYYFIDNEYYFKRSGLYGFYDDGERFAFFSRAILEMLFYTDFEPDIINCNDWQTALTPVYLNLYYRHLDKFSRIKTVFTNSVLALLFCIIFLSNFGYGAFDPLESFFYRDVLHVGVEWMGWLSSASGVGAVLGAVVALRLPPHLVNLKMLLVALMSVGVGSLIYVGTPHVGVALVGQIVLGVAWGVVNPLHNTIVQTTTPLEQLGRVNSVMGFGNMFAGVAPLAIAPWLAATFGVQQTLVGAGMVVTAVPAALLLFGRRHFDRSARQ